MKNLKWFPRSITNSYSQVFFSNNKLFGLLLIPVTFLDFHTGLFGLTAVMVANGMAAILGFEKSRITEGYYGFNALLVGMGLGIHFQASALMFFIVFLSGIFTLFISITMEGVIGKYGLPYLSIPFMLALWILMLASREFTALGISERGIYTLNDLYLIGGENMIRAYEWWNKIPIPSSIRSYLFSLGAIFFQYSVFTGLWVALGLLIYSRIAFTLSLWGFYAAYVFYALIGAEISETLYSYIGFNYILTSIALGGFFIIPHRSSYLWLLLIVPIVAILTIGLSSVFANFRLPVYALPFNIATLTFLYVLKFRVDNRANLSTQFIQHNSPERNLYAFSNYMERFGKENPIPIGLPFFGEWTVTQGYNGNTTHKGEWRYAWDFEIQNEEGKTYKNKGDYPSDYFCFDKAIIAPVGGVVEDILDGIDDNIIGQRNLEHNWGNTIVLKHSEYLYSQFSHLKKESITVRIGDKVKKGKVLGNCGNSGNCPYPHLHFQLQATPYIGSKTISYPLSHVLLKRKEKVDLLTVAIPEKEDKVSPVSVHPGLKKAFYFIHGKNIKWELEGSEDEVEWEVKLDYFFNRYLECSQGGSKAYFKMDENMLHFTHFEGDKESLLYLFYLSAYKVSFGFYSRLIIRDSYPINMVFTTFETIFQDFIAPFYKYLHAEYTLEYPRSDHGLSGDGISLKGSIVKKSWNRIKSRKDFSFELDQNGGITFSYRSKTLNLKAKCLND